MAGINRKSV